MTEAAISDSAQLKSLVKDALVEILQERQGLLYELLKEAMEDIALVQAIDEGKKSEPATREEVFNILNQAE
ncbi:MAG: hypothetical protein AAFR25_10040 [Cyanobacteria bacterium J06629_19]